MEILPNFTESPQLPLYIKLYKHIKTEILTGNIQPGSKLPSIRNLSKDLKLSKNTVQAAYEQLVAEGYIKAKDRSGLFVERLFDDLGDSNGISEQPVHESEFQEPLSAIKYNFSSGQIDVDSFPLNQFRKILSNCIDTNAKELLLYGDSQGDYGLRNEIANYVHASRGVNCTAKHVVLSSGTQQALSLLAAILTNFSKDMAVEDPGYSGAKAVFHDYGYTLNPISLTEDGIDINALTQGSSKIVYVTPSHQYPYGMVMSIHKRLKLLQWAKKNNAYIIEDDYDGEFRYRGKPIPSLQGLDESGRVIYLGSFSKSLMPSMRVSYLILPDKLLSLYESNYKIYYQPVPRLLQSALEIFIKEGHWERHLRKARVLYRKKQELLLDSIATHFGNQVSIIGAESGLHILLKVNTSMDEQALIEHAEASGIKLKSILPNWIIPPPKGPPVIFLGFAGIKLADIPEGIRTLKECWTNPKESKNEDTKMGTVHN